MKEHGYYNEGGIDYHKRGGKYVKERSYYDRILAEEELRRRKENALLRLADVRAGFAEDVKLPKLASAKSVQDAIAGVTNVQKQKMEIDSICALARAVRV